MCTLFFSHVRVTNGKLMYEKYSVNITVWKLKNKPHNGKNSYYLETNRTNLFSSIETLIQQGPPTTPTETGESTLPSDETPLPPKSITTPMLNNLVRFCKICKIYKWECFSERANPRPCRWDWSCENVHERTAVSAEKRLKKIRVMKKNTVVKTQNLHNFYVNKTLLYLRKMRLKTK